MSSKWRGFLKDAGAEYENEIIAHFGNPERERQLINRGLAIADLNHNIIMRVSGADNATFLQGQLTNNINEIDEYHSQLSGYCNQKGRLLASFRVFRREDDLYLMLPAALYEPVSKRLRMFVLRSDVTIEDTAENLIAIGFSGPEADSKLASHFQNVPVDIDTVSQENGYTIIRIAGTTPRYLIAADVDRIIELWGKLDVDATPVGNEAWKLEDIYAGLPTIYPENVEAFVPQMVNLDITNGVSFKKGCYTGQEIVARMHYLGKLKRRMFRVHIDSNETVQPGMPLYSPNTQSGQGTGNIVDVAPSPDGGQDALAVIQIIDAEAGELRLENENGVAVHTRTLPYEFPPPKKE